MYQLTAVGHASKFHKVRGYFCIPPLQGLWVDTYISELHLIFPRHISTDFLVPTWLHIIKYPETASQKQWFSHYTCNLNTVTGKEKKINLWLTQVPHIIGFGIRQTTIRSIISQ